MKREQWSSRLVFMLATTGAAVGLGNIWKFPYMAGNSGGSAFILLYLVFVILIGLPVMMAEIVMGKRGQSNPINTLIKLTQESNVSHSWVYLGWWSAVTLLLTFSFYSVVASWGIAYLCDAMMGRFHHQSDAQIHELWVQFLSSPLRLLFWDTLFVIMTGAVVYQGVEKGLERACNLMMPGLLIILFFLAGYSMMYGDAGSAIEFLFNFNIADIHSDVVISAMGQAFFSLSVGACCIMGYGSYLPAHIDWVGTIFYIVFIDVLVALLSGLAIFPLVFSHHLPLQSGPGLMFETLPLVFSTMSWGSFIGSLFFILLIFAAWTSSISLAEPLVMLLNEKYRVKRSSATLFVCAVAWLLSIGSLLSFNLWADYKLFGQWNFFAVITDLTTNVMLPLGGLCIAIFAGWKMDKWLLAGEFGNNNRTLFKCWLFLTRTVAPLGIVLILFGSVISAG